MEKGQIIYIVVIVSIIILLILFFMIFVFVWYRFRRSRHIREKRAMQMAFEQNLLQSRLETQEQTLNTISQEIHDNVGQLLSLAKVQLSIAEQNEATDRPLIAEIKNNIGQAFSDLRNIAKSLNGDRLRQFTLLEIIREELQRIHRSGALQCELKAEGDERPITEQKKTILFRIIQECLQNIIKHAGATRIDAFICYGEKELQIKIADNGKGFSIRQQSAKPEERGLGNIKTRTTLIGGSVQIQSKKDTGTVITLTIPYDE